MSINLSIKSISIYRYIDLNLSVFQSIYPTGFGFTLSYMCSGTGARPLRHLRKGWGSTCPLLNVPRPSLGWASSASPVVVAHMKCTRTHVHRARPFRRHARARGTGYSCAQVGSDPKWDRTLRKWDRAVSGIARQVRAREVRPPAVRARLLLRRAARLRLRGADHGPRRQARLAALEDAVRAPVSRPSARHYPPSARLVGFIVGSSCPDWGTHRVLTGTRCPCRPCS